MGERCRTACDGHENPCVRPCCTSHLPPETPRPAPRGVHRAAVGRSSDSWARRRGPPPIPPLPGAPGPSACVAGSFPITAAGQRRNGLGRRHRLPFQSSGKRPAGTDRTQDSGGNGKGQYQILWKPDCPCGTSDLPAPARMAPGKPPPCLRGAAAFALAEAGRSGGSPPGDREPYARALPGKPPPAAPPARHLFGNCANSSRTSRTTSLSSVSTE